MSLFSAPLRRSVPSLLGALILAFGLGACTDYVSVGDQLQASDLATIAATTQQALEKAKVGESTNWVNPSTQHRGTVTPTRTFTGSDGTPCRNFQQTATAGGRTAVAYDTACRNPQGQWQSVNYGSLSEAIRNADAPNPYRAYPPPYAGSAYFYGGYPGPYYCRFNDPFCNPFGPPWGWPGYY